MERYAHNPDTGQLFYRLPGNKWVPITQDDIAVIEESGPEAFARQLGETLVAPLRVPRALGSQEGRIDERRRAQTREREQEVRGMVNPGAALAGTVAGYLPDVVAGGVAGIGARTMGRQALRIGATEGVLGAARNPDDPLTGAALQGGIGAAAVPIGVGIGAVVGAAGGMAGRVAARLRGAGEAASETLARTVDDTGSGPMLRGMTPSSQLDELGVPLTPAQRAALDATTPEQLRQANALRKREELMRTAQPGTLGSVGARMQGLEDTVQAQRDFLTKRIAAELGADEGMLLTRENRAALREGVQQKFREIIDNNPQRISLTGNPDHADVAMQFNLAEMMLDVSASVSDNNYRQVIEQIAKIRDSMRFDGSVTGEQFTGLRAGLIKSIDSAFKNGNTELGQALSQINELLDQALTRTLAPDVAATLMQARKQWRILKALERNNAIDPGGTINPASFRRAYEAVTPAFKNASRTEFTDFERLIDTINYLTTRTVPSSGTAERLIANARLPGTIGVALGAGAATVLGN